MIDCLVILILIGFIDLIYLFDILYIFWIGLFFNLVLKIV